ncbi:MAG: T9SS type A sorting domain-containing protein [Bacteroidetes bacterium]|nr:T9SS type A sorting domain-containing protein [Bacteroidota bacterium]
MKTIYSHTISKVCIKILLFVFLSGYSILSAQPTAFRYDSTLIQSGLQNEDECDAYTNSMRQVLVVTNTDSSFMTFLSDADYLNPFLNETKQVYSLDSNRRVQSLSYHYGDSLSWINNSKEIYAYDASGRVICTTIQSWSDFHSSWVNYERDSTQFSASGLITRSAQHLWDTLSASWTILRSFDYTFDANDRLLEQTELYFLSSGSIFSGTKYLYSYNINGKLLSSYSLFYSVPYAYWQNANGQEYYYDAADRDTMDLTLTGDSVFWIPDTRQVKILNGLGLVILNTFSTWTAGNWVDVNRTFYDYNVQNLDSLETTQTFDGTGWAYSGQILSTYTPTNRIAERISQYWDVSGWVNNSDFRFTYDAADSLTEALSSSWVNGAWLDNSKDITIYYSYSPPSIYTALQLYSVNDGWQTVDEQRVTYDTANHIVYTWYDGHAGISGGEMWYDFYADGTLYHEHGYGCSMGGLGSIVDRYHYHLLNVDVQLNPSSGCPGDTLMPVVNVTGDNAPFTFLWTPGGAVSDSTLAEPYLFPIGSTDYYLSAYDDSGSVSIREVMARTFVPVPVDLGPDTLLCTGVAYVLDAGNQFNQYLWQDGSTLSSFAFTAGAPGNYYYSVLVTDSNQCRNSDTVHVTVDACNAIAEYNFNDVVFYPNPADNNFCIIQKGSSEKFIISLNAFDGKSILDLESETNSICIDTKALSDGVYICTFRTINSVPRKSKVIVKH